ncbi:MAG: DUF481 domain-containing protein [Phycisphaeraceae bacterium]|nr:DUF481 domain-containing protein [Phycisphaeraceae bacterium]
MWRSMLVWGLMLTVFAATAFGDKVTLSTGEVFEGTITQHDQKKKKIKFKHSILGEFEISTEKIQEMVDELPKAPPPPPPAWSQRLEFGITGSKGNTDEFNLYASYRANYVDEEQRVSADASYFLNKSSGVTTKNAFTAGVLKDWLLPESRWFYFAQTRFDIDKFEQYDWRLAASAGLGYDWIKEENLRVTLRVGAGIAKEQGSVDDSIRPEGLLGGEFDWKISKHQTLVGAVTYYPDLEELREFRAVGTLEWVVRFADMKGVSFKLGLKDEYESSVDPGILHNDLTYYAVLVVDF